MKNGYYLSTYTHIDPLANLNQLSLRHDQGMALWEKRNEKVKLVRYWEFERISGLKKHYLSFRSKEHARFVINFLLHPFGLSLDDMLAVWGTPGLDRDGQFSSYKSESQYPLHSLCHLFSGMLSDSESFYKNKILAFALDGAPDNVVDLNAREKQFYWGAFVDRGTISYFEIPSPGLYWGYARGEFGMEEGSMMALGSAVTSHLMNEENLAAEAPAIFNAKDIGNAYNWLKKIVKTARSLVSDEIPEYDSRFSLGENQIGIVVKVIQRASFRIVDEIITQALAYYAIKPSEVILSISGGFALNCPTNSNLMRKFGFQNFQTCPCVGDCGIALGLGLFEFHSHLGVFQFCLENAYYGSKDNRKISEIDGWGEYIRNVNSFERNQFVEDLTSAPLIWFDLGAEIGPRALGARSILGDPRKIETKDKLNEIKGRQWWRPVSPIVLEEEQQNWFENTFPSPYMLCTCQVKPEKANQVLAALHLDQSVRLQSLRRENNPLLYDAISAFHEMTGIPLICNTSLNDKGEPIIELFEQCINFALRKGIRIMYFNGARMELEIEKKYTETKPFPRRLSLFASLTYEEILVAKKNKVYSELFLSLNDIKKQLNEKLLLSKINSYPVSLFNGKMGLSIYLYHLSKIESNPEYQAIADKLIDQIILHDLSPDHSIDVENGLAGVGLGVTYLVKNRFVEGDLNELLEAIDNEIYRRIVFQKDLSVFSATLLLHLTGYLYIRLQEQVCINMQSLYQDLIIKVINMLYSRLDDDFLNESYSFSIYQYQLPVLLWIISKLLKAEFYNNRIYRMLDELQLRILSRFPLLHSNRLFLLWGMLNLKPYLRHDNAAWHRYIQLLYREINLDEILKNEMSGRKIFISNGLSAIYLLLHVINRNFPDFQIPFDPQMIYNQLQNSDAWNALIERDYFYDIHHGLLNGFPGVQLVLTHIENSYNLKPPPTHSKE